MKRKSQPVGFKPTTVFPSFVLKPLSMSWRLSIFFLSTKLKTQVRGKKFGQTWMVYLERHPGCGAAGTAEPLTPECYGWNPTISEVFVKMLISIEK